MVASWTAGSAFSRQWIVKLSFKNIAMNGNWGENGRTDETNTIHPKNLCSFPSSIYDKICSRNQGTYNTCLKYWWIAGLTCWIWNMSESTKDGGEKFCICFHSTSVDSSLNCDRYDMFTVQLFSLSSRSFLRAKIYGFSKISHFGF